MKNLKHLFTVLLLLCATVAAAHDFEVGGIFYKITSTSNLTVGVTYQGDSYDSFLDEYSGNVVIPESVTYNGKTYRITSIEDYAFRNCSTISSVVISNSVTSIDFYAFHSCSLTSILIGKNVTSIGNSAFYNCTKLKTVTNLSSLTFSKGSTSYGYVAKYADNVVKVSNGTIEGDYVWGEVNGVKTLVYYIGSATELELPSGNVNYAIGANAFNGYTALTSIVIPNSVTSIGDKAFYGCFKLKTVINLSSSFTITIFTSSNGYVASNANKVVNAPNGTIEGDYVWVEVEGVKTLAGYIGSDTELTLPSGNVNYAIGAKAFYGCSGLTSIEIPNSVTSIGNYAFSGCSGLTAVHIGDLSAWCNINFEDYSSNPLYYAENLYLNDELVVELIIPDGVTEIKKSAFCRCSSLTSIEIPNSVTSIGDDAFSGCTGLTSITIPNSVTSIGSSAFYGCTGLTSVVIPNSVTSIENEAFSGCTGLTSIVIPNSVTSIGNYAFEGCSGLTSIEIPNSVTSIGNDAFNGCTALTSIEIPNSVTSIGKYAFSGCSGLTSIVIPNSVTSIGNYAFEGCTDLKTVMNFSILTFSKGLTSYGYVAYYADKVVNAPNGTIEGDYLWAEVDGVKLLAGYMGSDTELVLPSGNVNYAIGGDAFSGCSSLTSIVIPNSVTSIGNLAFNGCSGLTSIVIPNSVTSIGSYAFNDCTALTSIEIPNSVTSIDGAFNGCTALTSIVIPNSVTSIGEDAFWGCKKLASIIIPNSVTSIGDYAFRSCSALTSIEIPNSVTSIGENAFEGCSGLKKVSLDCPTIGSWFQGNTYINEVVLTDNVTSIASSAFEDCTGLTSIVIPNSVTSIGEDAFWGCEKLASIIIPNSVTSISGNVFRDCSSLASIEISNSVTSICSSAFQGCKKLASLSIPGSVRYIYDNAFKGCSALKELRFEDGEATLALGFQKTDWQGLFYDCPLESVYLGRTLSYDNTEQEYGYSPFYNKATLTNLIIGNSVTSIGIYAFRDCYSLANVVIGDSVTSIGEYAFKGCSALTSIEIPNSVTNIDRYAFYECTGLTSAVIGNSVTSIGYNAFNDCTGLKSVMNFSYLTFSKGLTDYGYVAYYADEVVNAPNGTIEGDYVWGEVDGVKTLVCYTGSATELVLPSGEVNYVIGAYTFRDCTGLTSIEIPDCVTSIGNNAFYNCSGLTSIVIPNSVTSIGEGAFRGCSGVETLYISSAIESIEDEAFAGCEKIKEIKVDGETPISGNANVFAAVVYDNATLYIPYGTKSLYEEREPWSLFSNIVETGTIEGDYVWGEVNGMKMLVGYIGSATELVLPSENVNYAIAADAFNSCSALTSVTIPDCVTSIGNNAFYNCSGLTSMVIPNSVTSIGDNAFYGTSVKTVINLSSLTFSKGSTDYGYVAYYADKVVNAPNGTIEGDYVWGEVDGVKTLAGYIGSATELALPSDGVNYVIGSYAFKGCDGLTSIAIGNSVTSIGENAFNGCTGLTSIAIGNSVTSIGNQAFYECTGLKTVMNFSSLTFSKGSSDYGYVAYYADKVVNAPNGTIEGDYVWGEVNGMKMLAGYIGSATELVLPSENVNYAIAADAFNGCSALTSVTIPDCVTSIGNNAFYNCSGLTSMVIPNSVTSIGEGAFDGCTGLTAVHISDLAAWCGIDFGSASANPLYYAKNLYLNGEKLTELVIPDGIVEIKNYTFYNCNNLTSVEILNSVTSIGEDAFSGCTGLKTVINFSNLTFSKGSTGNGYVAYYADKVYNLPEGFIENDFVLGKVNGVNTLVGYLGNATELTLPADYKGENYAIGASVFQGNTTITSVEIPNSVTSIGSSAFYDCTGLTSVEIPNSVTSIGEGAFDGCTGLTAVHISDLAAWCGIDFGSASANPLYYAKNLYLNGEKLTELVIPDGIVEIKNYTFYNCNNLTSVEIPNSVTSIGENAFNGCEKIEEIKVEGDMPISGYANVFADVIYDNATLYIPYGTKSLYEEREPWSLFSNIVEMGFTGIDEVKGENGNMECVYDLSGRRITEISESGLYIVNGKKVLVK